MMLELVLEVDEDPDARVADSQKLTVILNDLWNLQNEAIRFDPDKTMMLTMRPFLIQQLRFQSAQVTHLYFLARMQLLLLEYNKSPKPIRAFERATGIPFEDFVTLSLFFAFAFSDMLAIKQTKITYEYILSKLYPSYSLETLVKFLTLVGNELDTLGKNIKLKRVDSGPPRSDDYFTESLFFGTPLLLLPSGVSTTHSYIACIGLSEFILRTLKDCDDDGNSFRKPFSHAFERYISDLFITSGLAVVQEDSLKKQYNDEIKNSKVVDYFYSSDGKNLFVDAKSVEPKQTVLSTQNPRVIKERLRDHLIGALTQARECANALNQSKYDHLVSTENRYILVISHQDFFVGSGQRLRDLLGKDYGSSIDDAVGNEFKLENVFYIAIAEFEGVIQLLQEGQVTIFEFLDYCKNRNTKEPLFNMRQYVSEFGQELQLDNPSPIGSDRVKKSFDSTFRELEAAWEHNSAYWRELGAVDSVVAVNEFTYVYNSFRKALSESEQ
ncbi:hypothetical protein CWE23_00255 [Idiomarina aquatica]|uniref:Uncharacterized protein n=2 Tax=Idiomarina aquatica TaxID=1327752 RepID=A0AA94EFH6_9GAMM|nr:hypothetical protein [Idiomarina aquatica]RUO44516.1 hypothetical protein CWE23_00255 [Idiomarina aquatica]